LFEGDKIKAEEYFLKAIELNPDFAKPYLSLSEFYLSENDYEKSDMWFKEFNNRAPEDPEGYFYLALRNSENPNQAIRNLELAFQKGFKSFDRLNKELRLAPLRKKLEYKNLVKKYFPDRV
jgi:tetratricopeptide (TPR) repeat protein